MMEYHLAQVNTAKMNADLDDPIMSGFVQRLDEINTLADDSKGFVWRFESVTGDATYLRPFDDKRILFNMSVWETLEDLRHYVYRSTHLELLKAKENWFTKLAEAHLALWWIPQGNLPSVEEALEKLRLIQARGVSPDAFTFAKPYPMPNKAPQPTSSLHGNRS